MGQSGHDNWSMIDWIIEIKNRTTLRRDPQLQLQNKVVFDGAKEIFYILFCYNVPKLNNLQCKFIIVFIKEISFEMVN